MITFSQTLAPGTLVRVRQRNYIIQDIFPKTHGTSDLLKLACIDDDAQGRRLDIAWDIESDAKIIPPERSALKLDRKPDEPKTFAAYLRALRWACVTSTDPTQERNIEAGVLLDHPKLAESLAGQFGALKESGRLKRMG